MLPPALIAPVVAKLFIVVALPKLPDTSVMVLGPTIEMTTGVGLAVGETSIVGVGKLTVAVGDAAKAIEATNSKLRHRSRPILSIAISLD